jgi:galacturan 1,4-alpha-galacturonidase
LARNTDGADVMDSTGITMRRWEVHNGDDSIALKRNCKNIVVEDCVFYHGQGFALGSLAQSKDVKETIENVHVRNLTCYKTAYGVYFKTWTGMQIGYPPNGGGGGTGCEYRERMTSERTLTSYKI